MTVVRCVVCHAVADVPTALVNGWYETHRCDEHGWWTTAGSGIADVAFDLDDVTT